MPDPADSVRSLLKALEELGPERLERLAAAIAADPDAVFRKVFPLLTVGPTPRFTAPPVPYSVPLATATATGVVFALAVNVNYPNNYTLQVYFNDGATPLAPTVRQGGVVIPSTAIAIPLAGSGNLVIDGGLFAAYGAGEYLLKITANNCNIGLGYGIACTDVVVTKT